MSKAHAQISRRSLLQIAVAAGATAVCTSSGTTVPAGASFSGTPAPGATPPLAAPVPASPAGRSVGARVGATFDLHPFKPGTTYPEAVALWNSTTGTTMQCAKLYYQLSRFPAIIDDRVRTLIDMGVEALISFKPAIVSDSADRDRLAQAMKMLHDANLSAQVCLWQEVSDEDMTATQYHTYVQYYGPVIRQYYPLVYNAMVHGGAKQWKAYDPGRDLVDGYALDFYCASYVRRNIRLGPMADLAGPLPLGVWEIGNTATESFFPTADQLGQYMDHITTFLAQRAAAGLPVGAVAWYNGPATAEQSGQNEIVGTHPNPLAADDIAHYRTLYHALNTGR
jgi:hypothetical protein